MTAVLAIRIPRAGCQDHARSSKLEWPAQAWSVAEILHLLETKLRAADSRCVSGAAAKGRGEGARDLAESAGEAMHP